MLRPAPTPGNIDWFIEARFGLFIHWGLYSLGARHEWLKNREEMTDEDYRIYFEQFNPRDYDPAAWARAAREAGMKYFVITTKHHEGFCLWDSKYTDYKAPNTPAGRDLLRPMIEAFRAEGLKVGFYHSLIDWHHPDFTIDALHPLRNHPEAEALNRQKHWPRYVEYLHNQVRELLTGYGPVDIMWFDYSYPEDRHGKLGGKGRDDWQSEKLLAMVRELAPGVIVNNRLDLPLGQADVYTPEQFQPPTWLHIDGQPVHWESVHTFSGSWGYHRDESTWKSPEQLIQLLIDNVACGGNLMMNVGPTALGTFDSRALAALKVYGDWMKQHGSSIYGCTQSEFAAPRDCRLTQNGNKLYLHVFNWPFRYLYFSGLGQRIRYAQLMNDASEVRWTRSQDLKIHLGLKEALPPDTVIFELPVRKPDAVVPVIEIDLA